MEYRHDFEIEKLLAEAAGRLPEPRKPVPVASSFWKLSSEKPPRLCLGMLFRAPVRRAAVIVLALLCVGTTTALAASPALREAVIRFFSFGTVERPPVEQMEETGKPPVEQMEETSEPAAETDPEIGKVQTAGSLTLIQETALDSSFTASYASSSDYLELIHTPSGRLLFCTRPQDAPPVYYALEEEILREIPLESRRLTASVQLGRLPGVMGYDGRGDFWDVTLPAMEFTLEWRQYGSDILIDSSNTDFRFDIGSTFGGLEPDYDGRFYGRAFPGRSDVIQVFFNFDGQRTGYEYPFLLYPESGRVADPLAKADLSAWPCITGLTISDDLLHATAMAGTDHERQNPITIDLQSGEVSVTGEPADLAPPVSDCFLWFATGEHTLFYALGSDAALDGYLYDTQNGQSSLLFSDAASHTYERGFAERYYNFIGGGYAVLYEDPCVYLLDLHTGSSLLLEGISAEEETSFFFNADFTLLSVCTFGEDGNTKRLGFVLPETRKAASFDREPPSGIHETSAGWYGPYGYVIQAEDTERGRFYLYLYEYQPADELSGDRNPSFED